MGGTALIVSWEELSVGRKASPKRLSWWCARRLAQLTCVVVALGMFGLAGAGSARADAFYDGTVAYNTRDYVSAARIWRGLAESGHAKAQSALGFLHMKGLGVPRDSVVAARWFLRAASQGVVEAQMFLGVMHLGGDGVRRSRVLAYMWSDVAVAAGYAPAIAFRAQLARRMSSEQISEGQQLALKWRALQAAALSGK